MFKVKNGLSPTFMTELFPDSTCSYNLRNMPVFDMPNIHTVHNGTETILFRGPKTRTLGTEEIFRIYT